jgi:glycosyltransferase 2 family protein
MSTVSEFNAMVLSKPRSQTEKPQIAEGRNSKKPLACDMSEEALEFCSETLMTKSAEKQTLRSKLLGPLRWVVAGLLLYWALSRGQIDPASLKNLAQDPLFALGLISILAFQMAGAFFRWKLLLKSQQIEIPFKDAFRLGMASQFFFTVGPGTLGADVARGLYISRHAPDKRLRGLSTVFLDRVLGLFGMLFLGAFSFLSSLEHLEKLSHKLMPALISLGSLLTIISASIILCLLFLPFLVKAFMKAKDHSKRKRLLKHPLLSKVFEILSLYSDRREYIWFGIFISIFMHILSVLVLWSLTVHFYGSLNGISPSEFFLGASLGVLVLALPLAPSGIGVGQVAFSTLFVVLGWPNESMGGTLVTAFQILTVLVNLSGIFFVSKRAKVHAQPS